MSEIQVQQLVMEVMSPFSETPLPRHRVQTMRFDAGEGSEWYMVTAPSDGGNELRAKNIKSMRATGKFTKASMKCYGYNHCRIVTTWPNRRGKIST